MIKRQPRKRLCHLLAARNDSYLERVEKHSNELTQQLGRPRRQLGGLDHAAIASRQNTRERPEGECHREVPRTDDTDDAQGLIHDLGGRSGRKVGEPQRPGERFHPTLQVLARKLQGVDRRKNIHEAGQAHRPLPEIRCYGLANLRFVRDQKVDGTCQPVTADTLRNKPFSKKRCPLRIQERLRISDMECGLWDGLGVYFVVYVSQPCTTRMSEAHAANSGVSGSVTSDVVKPRAAADSGKMRKASLMIALFRLGNRSSMIR